MDVFEEQPLDLKEITASAEHTLHNLRERELATAGIPASVPIRVTEDFRNKIAFDGMDTSRFKGGVDLRLLMKMLLWMAEGYTKEMSNKEEINFDNMLEEFNACLDMLKNNFYREEYL